MSLQNSYKRKLFYYWSLTFVGFLIMASGWILFRGIPILISVLVIYYGERIIHSKNWAGIIAFVFLWLSFAVSFPLTRYLTQIGENVQRKGKRFNSYISMYGADYQKPTLNQFGLLPEDYYAFNRRFQFDFIKTLLTVGTLVGIIYLALNIYKGRGTIVMIVVASIAIAMALTINYVMVYINDQISKKWSQYEKVKAFKKADDIHRKVKDELKEIRLYEVD